MPIYNIPVLITNGPSRHHLSTSFRNHGPKNLRTIKPNPKICINAKPSITATDNSTDQLFNPGVFKSRHGLGFIHLNIRSLCNQFKLDQLKIFISQTDPDILVITETWLKDCIHDSEVSIDGYNLYRTDRVGRKGGGVAVYIKSCLSVTVLKTVSSPHSFELIALKINLSVHNFINVVGLYRPPSAIPNAMSDITHILSQLSKSEMLVLGDFNLNWLSLDSDGLKEMCTHLNLTQIINEPTRPNLKTPP